MVVFTCNHCGDSLQKPRVEKHYNFVCRTTKSLTCIDCLKDFRGEEYGSHTKCLTEEERYAAKGAYANGIVKKGEVKQESWLEMIRSIIEKETNLKPPIKNLLNTISNYSNVPRKKPKFLNFIKSSSGGRANMKEVEEVWDIIEKYKADQQKVKEQSDVKQPENGTQKPEIESSNGINTNANTDVKKKKSKVGVENGESENNAEADHKQIKKSKKKKKQVEDEMHAEERMDIDTEPGNNGTVAKKTRKNISKKNETINEIGENLVNGETEHGEGNDGNCKIVENELKKKSKKKKLQDTGNEGLIDSKKPKLDTINGKNDEVSKEQQMNAEETFDFKLKVVEILHSKGTLSTKKLEKKVINAYLKHFGLAESSPKIVKKYNKKLKKIENIEIVDDNVILKTL